MSTVSNWKSNLIGSVRFVRLYGKTRSRNDESNDSNSDINRIDVQMKHSIHSVKDTNDAGDRNDDRERSSDVICVENAKHRHNNNKNKHDDKDKPKKEEGEKEQDGDVQTVLQKSHDKEKKEYKHATQSLGNENQALLTEFENRQLQIHSQQLRMNRMNRINDDNNGSDADHDITYSETTRTFNQQPQVVDIAAGNDNNGVVS